MNPCFPPTPSKTPLRQIHILVGILGICLVPACYRPPDTYRIMPLGDSISQADAQHDSYRRGLWHLLSSGGYAVDFVGSQQTHYRGPAPNPDFDMDHEAHWGWRADEVLAQVDTWTQSAQPDIVLLQLGKNDLLQRQSRENVLQDLAGIIKVLREHNQSVIILLARLIPTDRDVSDLPRLNEDLTVFAKKQSRRRSPVILVHHDEGFNPASDLSDGIHPNAAGEGKIAQKWFDALVPVLSSH